MGELMTRPICKKCVLPEHKPEILLDARGVCNICRDFQKEKDNGVSPFLETELVKILNKHKGKQSYDCLVMCSGGKDSTLSLYYMKKRYKLNVLAFTFDHGFENEEALDNIHKAIAALDVDWLYFKSGFMKDIFSKIITTGSDAPICHVCAIWYIQRTFEVASFYGVPLIVAGWTKGQSVERGESGAEYGSMSKATSDFIVKHLRVDPRYRFFPRSIKEAIATSQKKTRITAISPHWFLHYDPLKAMEILRDELRWKAPALSYPKHSTNCLMNFVSVYLTLKKFGFTHYHIELSKLIRKGELSRDEALDLLEVTFDKDLVNSILAKIPCQMKE